jgi:hypothetical protein
MNAFLHNLRITHRLTLISLCYVVPTAVMIYIIVASVNSQISFARLEMAGNEYQRSLAPLLDLVAEHGLAIAGRDQAETTALASRIDTNSPHPTPAWASNSSSPTPASPSANANTPALRRWPANGPRCASLPRDSDTPPPTSSTPTSTPTCAR